MEGRGSMNEDGSVNLGHRRKTDHHLTLLPEPMHTGQGSTPIPSTDPTALPHISDITTLWSSRLDERRQQAAPIDVYHERPAVVYLTCFFSWSV